MRLRPNYCRSFRQEAHQVWHDMSEAESFDLPRNEETTTQVLLQNLASKHKGRGLEINAYTKKEESKNGADWAFWFAHGTWNGVGARIQAKRLYADDGAYSTLYHQSTKQKAASKASGRPTPNQCETLLKHKDGLVPLYVFYNSDDLKLHSAISSHRPLPWWKLFGFPFFSQDWGVSAASALAIKKADWGKSNRPGDFPMIPWHCLVCGCCWEDRPADPSLPALVGHGMRQLYGYNMVDGEDDPARFPDMGFPFDPTDNAPNWVGLLREGRETERRLDEEMDRLNLKGIAIIQEVEARDE